LKWLGASLAVIVPILSGATADAQVALQLIAGRKAAVCQAYLKEMETPEGRAFECRHAGEYRDSRFESIAAPRWYFYAYDEEDPDSARYGSYLRFIKRHDHNPARDFGYKEVATWRGTPEQIDYVNRAIEQRLKERLQSAKYPILQVDIDNDGVQDQIVYLTTCDAPMMGAPAILDEHGTRVDERRTLRVLRNPIRTRSRDQWRPHAAGDEARAVADIAHDGRFGVFRFAGKTYFDFTWTEAFSVVPEPEDRGVIRVFLSEAGRTRAVCAIKGAQTSDDVRNEAGRVP
jgi:hypothetical protein